jgi:hypothetical protein
MGERERERERIGEREELRKGEIEGERMEERMERARKDLMFISLRDKDKEIERFTCL